MVTSYHLAVNLRKKFFNKWLMLLLVLGISPTAWAKEFWSDNSVTFLYGTTYSVPLTQNTEDKKRYVVTLEHVSDNSWGDVFSFLDIERATEANITTLYGEFIPRLSLYKLQGHKAPEKTFFSDLLLAGNLEYGVDNSGFNQFNYLFGIGTNLNIPGFQFFQLNFFRRLNQHYANNWQITPVFGLPFSIGNTDFRIDGWADLTSAVEDKKANIHTQIQAKWDLGKTVMHKPNTFYVGTEYKYWKHKFNITDRREQVWQLLAQVHF